MPANPPLQVRLLAAPLLTAEEVPLPVRGKLQRRLLMRLATAEAHPLSTDDLVHALWAADPPRTAAAMVASHVARLRATLGEAGVEGAEAIRHVDGGYRLAPHLVSVDVTEAASWQARLSTRRDLDEQALLWLHDLGLGVEEQADDAPWLARAVEQGWRHVRDVCGRLLDHPGDNAPWNALLGPIAVLAQRLPYDESVLAWHVEGLARTGNPAEALHQMTTYRTRLADDLGASPSAELATAHRLALELTGDRAAALPLRTNAIRPDPLGQVVPQLLPRPTPDFHGHHEVRCTARERLTDAPDEVSVVMITGAPGAGSSEVALQVAADVTDAFPAGQVHLDLRGRHDEADLGPTLHSLLIMLGRTAQEIPTAVTDCAAMLRHLTSTAPMLWIFDNVAPQLPLAPLIPTAPGSALIVTGATGHPDVAGATMIEIGPLSPRTAMRIFTSIAGAERVRNDPAATDTLIDLCEGFPAAVRNVALRAADQPNTPLSEIAAVLSEDRTRLAECCRGGHALDATFGHHVSALPERAAEAFTALGLLDGPQCPTDLLAHLLEIDDNEAALLLDDLVRARLITDGQPPRVSRLTRAYARRLWDEQHASEQTAAAAARRDGVLVGSFGGLRGLGSGHATGDQRRARSVPS